MVRDGSGGGKGHLITAAVGGGEEVANGSKTEQTIAKLARLLDSSHSAEELRSNWFAHGKEQEPKLSNLYKALDSGRTVSYSQGRLVRGVPMKIVVRTCKAKWHHDGTWPLLGCDEEQGNLNEAQAPRSIHPSALLLRPPNVNCFSVPEELGPAFKAEPTAEQIAIAYRKRGVHIEDVKTTEREEDGW